MIGVSPLVPEFSVLRQLNYSLSLAIESNNVTAEKIYLSRVLDIVLSNETRLGTSNPNTDPEGYRALMVLQLSSLFVKNSSTYYLSAFQELNATGKGTEVAMGSALFAYVQSGEVYYDIALYRSSAISHHIPFIVLPPQVNLGSANFSSFYSRAEVSIVSGGRTVVLHGAPIFISLTIPNGFKNKVLASSIVLFLISPEGKALMKEYGISPLSVPEFFGSPSDVPQPLRSFINSSVLAYG